jgi:hypothetical protein
MLMSRGLSPAQNLTPNPFPRGKGNRTIEGARRATDFLIVGAGLSPAEGSVKPTAGFTFDKVIFPSRKKRGRPIGRPLLLFVLVANYPIFA